MVSGVLIILLYTYRFYPIPHETLTRSYNYDRRGSPPPVPRFKAPI